MGKVIVLIFTIVLGCIVGMVIWVNTGEPIIHQVPFTCQAPFAEWGDPRQRNGCEEACAAMIISWVEGEEELSKEEAKTRILNICDSEESNPLLGFSQDTGVRDTAKLLEVVAGVKCEIIENPDIKRLRKLLDDGYLVVVPINGTLVDLNSRFREGGRKYNLQDLDRHMMLLIGYNKRSERFIVHDPGTRNGEQHEFSEKYFVASISDYPSGLEKDRKPIEKEEIERRVIVVRKIVAPI